MINNADGDKGIWVLYFNYLGFQYRTNCDASLIEALDGAKWHRTGSLRIDRIAKEALNRSRSDEG